MASQNDETQGNTNIIDSMNKAFGNGSFYGLEYVLDELEDKKSSSQKKLRKKQTIDWYGFWDKYD